MKLSVVATLYNSARYIEEFHKRISAEAAKLAADDYEIILVDDGSPDNSLEVAVTLTKNDQHVKVLELSRNFGHHKAMMTGLAAATGEQVFLIDVDLEEEPEYLTVFAEQLRANGCDVVYGVQEKRKGGWFERWSGKIFYRFFQLLTSMPMPENICTVRLMTMDYVQALLRHQEREVFMAGLWFITGFKQQAKIIIKHNHSPTTYNLRRKLSLVINSITAFSNLPLIGIFYIGLLISSLSAGYALYLIIQRIFWATPLSGWTSTIASIFLMSGMIISFIGVIGIYLSKIFSEVKQRPYTIVRQIHEQTRY